MLLKNARIINPKNHSDIIGDIQILNGKIVKISKEILSEYNEEVINCTGKVVTPGFVDVHCHLREPGQEAKENIKTGIESAINGGYSAICPMANTIPTNDNLMTLSYCINKAKEVSEIGFYPICALTKNLEGEKIVNISELLDNGAIAFSDDGKTVENLHLLRTALKYANSFGSFIISHSQDYSLSSNGVINEGQVSAKCGLKGISYLAEAVAVARELEIVRETNAKYHFAHISTKRSIELIRQAKKEGLKVTCETAPHYFSLSENDIKSYEAVYKVNPPLQKQEDVDAVIEGLIDGTIDIIATDHAPHKVSEKQMPIQNAPMGIAGFETSLGLILTKLVHSEKMSLEMALSKITSSPAEIFNIKNQGNIEVNSEANLTIIDINENWTVDSSKFKSKCKISPFDSMNLKGKVKAVIIKGKLYEVG